MPAWKWIMTTLFKTRTLLSLRKLGMLFGKPSNFTFVSSFWFIFLFLVFFFVQKLLIKRRKILKYIYHVIKNKKQKKMNFPEKVEQLAEKSGFGLPGSEIRKSLTGRDQSDEEYPFSSPEEEELYKQWCLFKHAFYELNNNKRIGCLCRLVTNAVTGKDFYVNGEQLTYKEYQTMTLDTTATNPIRRRLISEGLTMLTFLRQIMQVRGIKYGCVEKLDHSLANFTAGKLVNLGCCSNSYKMIHYSGSTTVAGQNARYIEEPSAGPLFGASAGPSVGASATPTTQ